MTLLFWTHTLAMIVAAISIVAILLQKEKLLLGAPGIIVAFVVPLIATDRQQASPRGE